MKRNITLACAVALSLGFSNNAFSATSTLNSSLVFNSQNVASFSDTIAPGFTGFNDVFSFTTTANSGGASAIASFNGVNFSAGFSAFDLLDLTHGNTLVATGTISPSFVGQLSFFGLNSNTTYGLNIAGTVVNPSVGGYYSGSVSVSPIPEPGEYALMLCGLVLLGFIASYRRQGFFAA